MDESGLREHVRQLDRCNQRGGRMLSLTDLLNAGTVGLDLGAYLAAAMRSGASLMVGANPGGAGKTTVMAALLNWIPNHTCIVPAETQIVLRTALSDQPLDLSARCFVAHEVGSGSHYAYVWGEDARSFFALARKGYIIATNLHADTLFETRHQLLRTNGVASRDLDAVTLKVFLKVKRMHGWQVRRTVSRVYESDGSGDHLLWTGDGEGNYVRAADSALLDPSDEAKYRDLLARMQRDDIRFIEHVRRLLLDED